MGLLLAPLVADGPARYSSAAVLFVTVLGYCTWVWAIRGTWMSATKHKLAGGTWAGLAKAAIVMGILRTVGGLSEETSGLTEHLNAVLGKQAGSQFTIRVSPDGKSLVIAGGMNDGAAAAMVTALDLAPSITTVTFDSTGGWIREGRLVGDVISRRKLATFVEGECSSACTLAFVSGGERTMGPRARLGFHQVRTVGSSDDERSKDLVETRSLYQKAGLPKDFIDKVVSTPPGKLWCPTMSELRSANVITTTNEWEAARTELTGK